MKPSPPFTERLRAVEDRFGDPWDDRNPTAAASFLRADAARTFLPAGRAAGADLELAAEIVPVELGGRLRALDELARLARSLMRRDATLAVDTLLASFAGLAPVWMCGSVRQGQRAAGLVLTGHDLGARYLYLPDSSPMADRVWARPAAAGTVVVRGRRAAISNAQSAPAISSFVEAGDDPRHRHGLLLAERGEFAPGQPRVLERLETVGARGAAAFDVAFDAYVVPIDAVVGRWSAQAVARTRTPVDALSGSALIGLGDTALRLTIRALSRAGDPTRHRSDRAVIAGAFADLMAADALASVATRTVHITPGRAHTVVGATRHLVSRLVGEMLYRLSVVVTERCPDDGPAIALLDKVVRDFATIGPWHHTGVSRAAVLRRIVEGLIAVPWAADAAADDAVFALGTVVPALDAAALLTFDGADGICASIDLLMHERDGAGDLARHPLLGAQCEQLRRVAEELQASLRRLTVTHPHALPAGPSCRGLERYALLLAASSCLRVWADARRRSAGSYVADPGWLMVALDGLLVRLERPGPRVLTSTVDRHVDEAVARVSDPRSFDLTADQLRG